MRHTSITWSVLRNLRTCLASFALASALIMPALAQETATAGDPVFDFDYVAQARLFQVGDHGSPAGAPSDYEMKSLLSGYLLYDVAYGNQIYREDPSVTDLLFVVARLDLLLSNVLGVAAADATAVLQAVIDRQDPAYIESYQRELSNYVMTYIGQNLGQEYMWYFQTGANMAALEGTIYDATTFNIFRVNYDLTTANLPYSIPDNPAATEFEDDLLQLNAVNGQPTQIVELFRIYSNMRLSILMRYGFSGYDDFVLIL